LARESLGYNVKNANFRKMFPEWVEEHARREQAAAAATAAAPTRQQQQQQQQQHGLDAPGQGSDGKQAAAVGVQPQQPQPQPQQQQQQQPGHGGQPAHIAGGGSSFFTAAVIALVLAIAVFPLCSSDMRTSLALLKSKLFPEPGVV
jgi:hypothetical protein